mmetsp:Transcript_27264/g.64615  ORF Transcript_27264/g.64615 Transcript_27264/m.64615 type:complete len:253 (+) Transcript_27264:987-1745(+)
MTCFAPSAWRTLPRRSSSISRLLLEDSALRFASLAASLRMYSSRILGGQSDRTWSTQLAARKSTIGPASSLCTSTLKENLLPGRRIASKSARRSRRAPAHRTNFWLPASLRVSAQTFSTRRSSVTAGVRLCTRCSQYCDRRVSSCARLMSRARMAARIVARSATRWTTPSSPTWLRIVPASMFTAPLSSSLYTTVSIGAASGWYSLTFSPESVPFSGLPISASCRVSPVSRTLSASMCCSCSLLESACSPPI